MDAWSLMCGDAFIHFVSGSRRVNIRLGVLLLIPKSPTYIWFGSNKIEHDLFQAAVVSILQYNLHHMDNDGAYKEKARQELHKNVTSYIEQILEATSHETSVVQPPTFYL